MAGFNHSSTGAEAPTALQKDNAYLRPGGPASEVANNDGTPMHSGQIPSIADVRSPDVLHSLSHPIMVSPGDKSKNPINSLLLFIFAALSEH